MQRLKTLLIEDGIICDISNWIPAFNLADQRLPANAYASSRQRSFDLRFETGLINKNLNAKLDQGEQSITDMG